MKILDEGALYKALPVTQETPDGNNPVRQFMRLLTMDNAINKMLSYQNIFY